MDGGMDGWRDECRFSQPVGNLFFFVRVCVCMCIVLYFEYFVFRIFLFLADRGKNE